VRRMSSHAMLLILMMVLQAVPVGGQQVICQ